MTHTATPWYISNDKRKIMAKNANQQSLQDITISNITALDMANAAFIVRACNSHDDLVAVLQDIEKKIGNGYEIDRTSMCADIIQALAKATHE